MEENILYYQFEIFSLANDYFHLDITNEGDCSIQSVELLPLTCPYDQIAFVREQIPIELFKNNQTFCKFNVSYHNPQTGMWYIVINADLSSLSSPPKLVITEANCNSFCVNGYCSSDGNCSCYTGWKGASCDSIISSITDFAGDSNATDIPLPQIIGIIAICILVGMVLMILIVLVANYLVKKKRANDPGDTLFTMLAQEQDLDTL